MQRLTEEHEDVFFSAFNYAAIGMALVGPDGRWLKVNNALCGIIGYPARELMTKTFQDITHPEDLDEDLRFVNQMLAGEIDSYQMEKRYFHRDGHIVHILLSVSLVRNQDGSPRFFISQIQDISRQKQLAADLARMVREDDLTQVFNRRYFMECASRDVRRGCRFREPQALMMIDIDHFKRINDAYGHGVGDDVLRTVAGECRNALRSVDVFGRLGGEEFAALLLNADSEIAWMLAERMRQRVEKCVVETVQGPVQCTVSIGLATFTAADMSLDMLLHHADEALYEAKDAGRNRIVAHSVTGHGGSASEEDPRSAFVRLAWSSAFESGCAAIDRQHRNLFLLGNDLLGGIVAGLPDDEVVALGRQLVHELAVHFRDEEKLFREAFYPGADDHSRLHSALLQDMRSILDKFSSRRVSVAELFELLVIGIVKDHFLTEDRKFFPYLHTVASC